MRDVRLGLRMLAREPSFAAIAVLTLALGIGANTAIFTRFNAIRLEPLPVREPGRLVLCTASPGEGTSTGGFFAMSCNWWRWGSRSASRWRSAPRGWSPAWCSD